MNIKPKDNSILVFAPHHDDEAIGMGGTIRLFADSGLEVNLAVVTGGYTSIVDPRVSPEESMRTREKECRAAASILGIKNVEFLRMHDHALEFDQDSLGRFVSVIRKYNPNRIYLPHQEESDRDHRVVSELGREAAWISSLPSAFPSIEHPAQSNKAIYYEVWTPMQKIQIWSSKNI